jgi:hypothetical protein
VARAGGTSAAGVKVVGAWTGVPAPDHAIDEATLVNSCTTSGGGSCVLLLDAAKLPVTGPISVAVTNLEDQIEPYDTTKDGVKSAEFN